MSSLAKIRFQFAHKWENMSFRTFLHSGRLHVVSNEHWMVRSLVHSNEHKKFSVAKKRTIEQNRFVRTVLANNYRKSRTTPVRQRKSVHSKDFPSRVPAGREECRTTKELISFSVSFSRKGVAKKSTRGFLE